MNPFTERVALITGAGSGIGRALAALLAREGARVAALDLNPAGLLSLEAELPPGKVAHAVCDVTDLNATRAAVAKLEQQQGPIDLLIASAGIGRKTPADPFSAEDINAVINVNLTGVVNSIDAVLPGMRQRGRGHLVALSSLASYRGMPWMAGYSASKAAVNALFDSLRLELPALGIQVTTVCPGWIRTPMTADLKLKPGQVMEVEHAARTILDAVRKKRPFVAFPGAAARQVWLLRFLPRSWSDWLAGRYLKQARKLTEG